MIEVEHLHKSYGSVQAVCDVSFEVDKGSIVGFLGPNGAGKSTTLRILAGFLGATSGKVRIAGHDIEAERLEALRHIGYMPETSPLYPEMRVREYLSFRAELKGIGRRARRAEVGRVLEVGRVADFAEIGIGHLSKGYRQRVGLCDALLGSPPLLILDEPSAGLDPNQIREVRGLIRTLEEHTVLLSTHILSEVEATCDRAVVISDGRLVATGSIAEIRGRTARGRLELTVGSAAEAAARALDDSEHVGSVTVTSRDELTRFVVQLEGDAGAATEALVAELVRAGVGLRAVVPAAASLEQVFAQLTRDRVPGDAGQAPDSGTGSDEDENGDAEAEA